MVSCFINLISTHARHRYTLLLLFARRIAFNKVLFFSHNNMHTHMLHRVLNTRHPPQIDAVWALHWLFANRSQCSRTSIWYNRCNHSIRSMKRKWMRALVWTVRRCDIVSIPVTVHITKQLVGSFICAFAAHIQTRSSMCRIRSRVVIIMRIIMSVVIVLSLHRSLWPI